MSFFKKKDGSKEACCCSKKTDAQSIKVLGAGCKSCHQMYENTKQAVQNQGLDVDVEYITDMEKVIQYGAMSMPVLVVNEKVVSVGRVLKPKEIEKLIH